jgi:hypothetical protein
VSHQAAADAQRAAEAQKAAELKAIQQAAEEVKTQNSTASAASAGPVDMSRDHTIPVNHRLLGPNLHHLMTTWKRLLDVLREKGKQSVRDLI